MDSRLRIWYRLLLLAAVVVFFAAGYFFSSITIPFLIPVIFAYLFSPLVEKMHKRGLPRFLAALLILLLILSVVFAALSYVLPMLFRQVKALTSSGITFFPKVFREADQLTGSGFGLELKLQELERQFSAKLPFIDWHTISVKLKDYAESFLNSFMNSLPNIVQNMVTTVYFLVIIPFLLFFFLKDGRMITRKCINMVPNRFFEMAGYMVARIDNTLGRFLRGIFIENSIIAFLAIIGFSIIGLKNAVLIGLLVGIFNVIPYMGPTIGFIIGSMVVFIDPAGNPSLIAVLIVISIVQLTDNVLVYPLAIGKSVNIHPISIIASLLFGGFFFGIIGMLLAVPIMTTLSILFKTYNQALKEYRI